MRPGRDIKGRPYGSEGSFLSTVFLFKKYRVDIIFFFASIG